LVYPRQQFNQSKFCIDKEAAAMASQPFKVIEHPADTGFEVTGKSLADVFRAAAAALFLMMWEINKERVTEPVELEISGSDSQELLVNFLEEFLYLYDAKGLVCTRVEIHSISNKKLAVAVWLQPFDNDLDQDILGVKAVTYHQMYIGKQDDVWLARVFLDI
jgi:SHS2 domain-containing protein